MAYAAARRAIDALWVAMRPWVAAAQAICSLLPDTVRAPRDAPDDVIAGAGRLVLFARRRGPEHARLAEPLIAAIAPLIDEATRALVAARTLNTDVQAGERELRVASRRLHRALSHLRRILAAELGRNHLAYQCLRDRLRKKAPPPSPTVAAPSPEAGARARVVADTAAHCTAS
jgi:hypothetical protein